MLAAVVEDLVAGAVVLPEVAALPRLVVLPARLRRQVLVVPQVAEVLLVPAVRRAAQVVAQPPPRCC
jgi:hypothetical protein